MQRIQGVSRNNSINLHPQILFNTFRDRNETYNLKQWSYPFEAESYLNNIQEFSYYLKGDTARLHYNDKFVNADYSKNNTTLKITKYS